MNAKPWAERAFIVVGVVAWLVVTVAVMVGGSSEAILSMALCWVALVAFIAMARFVDRISGFK